jgi:integrase
MGRGINRLSPARVRSVKTRGMYADGAGLYLRVEKGAHEPTKSWLFRYGVGGRERYCGLGPLHTIGLAEAREKAKECRQIILDGGDPIAARRARRSQQRIASAKAMTFRECAKAYILDHAPTWRTAKSGAQWVHSLTTYAYPAIGSLLVKDIGTGEVLRVLEPIWKTKTRTAARVRGRIESILAWAAVRGYRASENPARWTGHLKEALPAPGKLRSVEHLAALPYTEVAAFMADLRKDTAVTARALEFVILTATRLGEVLGAKWDEVDLKTWAIPPERTKANREHRVPLCDRALTIVAEMREVRSCEFVFPGRSGRNRLGPSTLQKVIARLGRKGEITAHGFRATFRTWASEKTTVQREVAEAALGHVIGDRVEASYQRGDLFEKRRKLMDAWAAFCAGTAARAKVLPIRRAMS